MQEVWQNHGPHVEVYDCKKNNFMTYFWEASEKYFETLTNTNQPNDEPKNARRSMIVEEEDHGSVNHIDQQPNAEHDPQNNPW